MIEMITIGVLSIFLAVGVSKTYRKVYKEMSRGHEATIFWVVLMGSLNLCHTILN